MDRKKYIIVRFVLTFVVVFAGSIGIRLYRTFFEDKGLTTADIKAVQQALKEEGKSVQEAADNMEFPNIDKYTVEESIAIAVKQNTIKEAIKTNDLTKAKKVLEELKELKTELETKYA